MYGEFLQFVGTFARDDQVIAKLSFDLDLSTNRIGSMHLRSERKELYLAIKPKWFLKV